MDQTTQNYISPKAIGIVLLVVYASLFVIVPFFAIYNGWVYIIGCLFFGIGLRWQIVEIVKRGHIWIGIHYLWLPGWSWKNREFHPAGWKIPVKNEERFTRVITVSMITGAILIVPIMSFVTANQAIILGNQIEQNTQEITDAVRGAIAISNERLGTDIVFAQDSGFKGVIERVFGDTFNDVKDFVKGVLKTVAKSTGKFFGDWLKVTIATFIISTLISPKSYKKAVKAHRAIISMGIQDEAIRNTVLRGGELFQEKIGQFMVGYLEVALRLIVMFFAVIYVLLPSGLGFLSALGISIFLGFITAIPKIGGLIGMVLGFILMSLNLQTGFGWFGYNIATTTSAFLDTLIRMTMLGTIAKVIGLFEAYKFTPEIVGEKLGLDKIQIVFVVVMFAFGGFYWMVWGVIGLTALATAIALALEIQGKVEDKSTAEEWPGFTSRRSLTAS